MYIFNRWPRVFRSSIFFVVVPNLPQFKNWLHSDFLFEISFFSDKLLLFVSINKNDPPYLAGLIHFSMMVDGYSFFRPDNLIDKEKSWKFLNSQFWNRILCTGACGHVDVGTCPHQLLAVTLTLSQPRGQIMPTLYWCPHQVLKATGAPVLR